MNSRPSGKPMTQEKSSGETEEDRSSDGGGEAEVEPVLQRPATNAGWRRDGFGRGIGHTVSCDVARILSPKTFTARNTAQAFSSSVWPNSKV
jgi:hypothetical protein